MAEIPKAYDPGSVEDKWYDRWLKAGCFTADPARVSEKRPAYSIVIPPPNVTGVLHMGHVLNNTIQDILSRKARMEGKEVLWLPGTDHAGIATEGMVSKKIWKEEKKSKREIGREEFIKRVWEWKEKHGGIIIAQLKKLGCSCDWTREHFTMDPEYVRHVQRVFVDLYKKGLIYRGKRMVNWCPATQTALSDEEVEMKPQKGFMYHFKVEAVEQDSSPVKVAARPLTPSLSPSEGERVAERPGAGKSSSPQIDADGRTWLTIATTRPETIPGDTAVAVNPKDPRYAHLVGKHIARPLPPELPREQKLIPIIADEHVDFEFGTGVLKVTPAHDKADFAIGQRHKLLIVDIMHPDATMNELAGADLKGLDRFQARKVAVEKLTELGALVEEKPYENNVGFSQRADVPIEPRLSEQWFLKYPAVPQSKACVAEGRMKFHPERWAKVYDHWLTNIQDWCISRQLWWGHRIPVWQATIPLEKALRTPAQRTLRLGPALASALTRPGEGNNVSLSESDKHWTYFVGRAVPSSPASIGITIHLIASTDSEAEVKELEPLGFTQDPDVLDTWFSSWLWPFATMGWPEQTETLKKFYPTTDLVTGPDIIFFWVARMVMAGYEYMSALPFKNVYFTGIVRDKTGDKMSKAKGNSPDPLELIAKYGADAIRFGTMRGAPLGLDVMFDEKDVELGRNFCNKLWNACRFRQMQSGEATQGEIDPALLTSDDKWILLKLDRAIREIDAAFAEYRFNEVTQTLYRFFWSEYCDWYIEASKSALGRPGETSTDPTSSARRANTLAVIDFVLSHALRLFHPFLPFITEELWHGMGYQDEMPEEQGGQSIQFAPWPKPFEPDFKRHYGLDEAAEVYAAAKYELVTQARNLRRESNIASSKRIRFVFKPNAAWSAPELETMRLLLNAEPLELVREFAPAPGTLRTLSPLGELFLPLAGLVDVGAERARLAKELAKIELEIQRTQERLDNTAF